jgi:iron only hydrogenase large subunit-like protein
MSHHKPDPNKSVNLTIDGIPVTVPEGTRILEAAKKVNVNIPTLCEHPDLCKRAVCRICVVECDGKGKLAAACANDVWEGVSVVTNNKRLLEIRKTILELILADHPQDCLSCIRSKNCELQSLAAEFGIRSTPFERSSNSGAESAVNPPSIESAPSIESETIVRDMDKCVKCGRCVEACQEVQTIRAINTSHRSHEYGISAPYNQSLEDGLCVFCGKCASVCPVGAIYEHDQGAQVWAKLNSALNKAGGQRVIAQISPELAETLNSALFSEFVLADGTVTAGKMITAVRLLGFDRVFDATISANIGNSELCGELEQRIKDGGKLPLISGNSQGVTRFIRNFYPSLIDHLSKSRNTRQVFAETVKAGYAAKEGLDPSNITSVSFVPDIAQKYGSGGKTDFALTAAELARMIKLAGIEISALPESSFDTVELPNQGGAECLEQKEVFRGYAQARKVMEAIQKGECTAKWVEIESRL